LACLDREKANLSCYKENRFVQDTTFADSDILVGAFYNRECKIKELNLITKLDDRSALENMRQLLDVSVKYGKLGDTLMSKVFSSRDSSISFDQERKLLYLDILFDEPILDSVNLIELKTISKSNNPKKKIELSESYFYNQSLTLLGFKNTYLDYRAFKNCNIVLNENYFFDDSTSGNLLITIKIKDQNIDDIENISIILNDSIRMNFRASILASFQKSQRLSGDFQLVNFIKRTKEHLELNINRKKSNFNKVDRAKILLNDKTYTYFR